ncbi:MAG: glycosyltransferase [Actinobacteria bacterium]|nr:glycosyltransferase [Actinomycetota bacterium]
MQDDGTIPPPVDRSSTTAPWCSVVIPAHDEETVIVDCLVALADAAAGRPMEVVVAANGCTDRTAEVARATAVPGLTVLELDAPSKIAALNAGDEACTAFPRIYLDADIVLGPGALSAMVEALSGPDAVVAAPHVRFDTSGSSVVVRAYYEVFRRLPYVADGLIGLGVYGISEAGRRRFGDFPDITADDLFVQRSFAPSERLTTAGTFVVRTPADTENLVRVRTRVARGNDELAAVAPADHADFSTSGRATGEALARLVLRRPWLAPHALAYVAVVAAGRRRAVRTDATWDRDDSSR